MLLAKRRHRRNITIELNGCWQAGGVLRVRIASEKAAEVLVGSRVRGRGILLRVAGVTAFVGLIAAGAHLKVGGPIPFTVQTLFVLLAGALLGPADAAAAVVLYVAAGAAGVPLFAGAESATGLSYLKGVTGGYLAGFVVAAVLVGAVTRRTEKLWAEGAAFAAGTVVILVLGTVHLWLVVGMSASKAVLVGFVPFLPGDIVKAAIAFGLYKGLRTAWKRF